MDDSEDREITLGTGKMLALFFGLVALCAVFFGMGFSLGKNYARSATTADLLATTTSAGGVRPSAVKSTGGSPSSDLPSYKAVLQKDADSRRAASNTAGNAPGAGATPSDSQANPPNPTAPPPLTGYYGQFAEVRKGKEEEGLGGAL